MAKIKGKPTENEIKERFTAYENYYSQLHTDQTEIDEFYELDFDAGVPTMYPTRMPPTARKWVDVGVIHFTLDNPKSRVSPRNDSNVAMKQVANLETFYNFWLRKDILVIKRAAKKLLKRGEVFLKVNMDDTYFGDNSEERLFHFPLFLSIPDPINVYCSPAHNGLVPDDVIESFDITVAEALSICQRNGWKWKTKLAPDKTVTWFSYISPQWRYFSIEDDAVLPQEIQPNLLGFTPYVHIDAGFGDESYEGKPESLYRSILWPLQDMLKMEVRNLSQTDAIISRFAWPHRKLKGASAAAIQEALKQLYPGGQFPTEPDKFILEVIGQLETEVEAGEDVPPAIFTQQAMMRDYSNPPTVLSGLRPTGVYSGQHQEDLMLTAKSNYKDAFKNLEDALGVAMGMGTRIIEKVYKYPVQIKNFASKDNKAYTKISPSDINGHYDCEVTLLAEPPEANEMRKGLGKAYWQGGAISQKTMLKDYFDMSEEEAETEIARCLAEKGAQQPGALEVTTRDAMKRFGMDIAVEELEAVGQTAVNSQPPVPTSEKVNLPPAGRMGTQAGLTPNPTRQESLMGTKI